MRPPLPPCTRETAIEKVRKAEDAWNTRDPAGGRERLHGGQHLAQSLRAVPGPRGDRGNFFRANGPGKPDYRLVKELWALHRQPHCGSLPIRVAR